MHIRQQGSNLALIRTTYDAERRRGVQSTIGRIPAYTHPDNVPSEALSQLTEEEKLQLRDYLQARAEGELKERQKASLRSVGFSIREAVKALDAGLQPTDPAAVWEALGELQKALKKAGHPKPSRAAGDAKEPV